MVVVGRWNCRPGSERTRACGLSLAPIRAVRLTLVVKKPELLSFLAFAATIGVLVAVFHHFKPPRYKTQAERASPYVAPVETKEVHADWKRYTEDASSGLERAPQHGDITLLSPNEVLERNVPAGALIAFMRGVAAAVDKATTEGSPAYRMSIEVTLSADAPRYSFAVDPALDEASKQRIEAAVGALAPLHTEQDEVKLEILHFVDRE